MNIKANKKEEQKGKENESKIVKIQLQIGIKVMNVKYSKCKTNNKL